MVRHSLVSVREPPAASSRSTAAIAAPRASPCPLPPSSDAAQRGTPSPSRGGRGHPSERQRRPAAGPARAALTRPRSLPLPVAISSEAAQRSSPLPFSGGLRRAPRRRQRPVHPQREEAGDQLAASLAGHVKPTCGPRPGPAATLDKWRHPPTCLRFPGPKAYFRRVHDQSGPSRKAAHPVFFS